MKDFIETKAEAFGGVLEVEYVQGAKPELLMFNDDGFEAEAVSIDKWKVEHIEEYLRTKLSPDDVVDM